MKRVWLMAAVAGIAASSVLGASLTSVGVLNPNDPYSDVKALTVQTDGTIWAVGGSKNTAATPYNNPYVWSSSGGMVELPEPSGSASDARGVSIIYKSSIVGETLPQIAVSGNIGNIARGYNAPLTALTSGTWVASGATPNNYTIGAYNTSRTDQSRTDGRTQVAGRNPNNGRGARFRWYPSVGLVDYPTSTAMQSVSESGVCIGERRPTGTRQAVYAPTANANPIDIPGGGLLRSEGYGISADGQWMSGLDYTDLATTSYQAFTWKLGDASMTVRGRVGADTRAVAYSINNTGVGVGMSWNATDGERAAIWQVGGQAKLLQSMLDGLGVDTSAWTKLSRATTISDDGLWVGGFGTWAEDGSTRGFIAMIPEPATGILLALGALVLRRRR